MPHSWDTDKICDLLENQPEKTQSHSLYYLPGTNHSYNEAAKLPAKWHRENMGSSIPISLQLYLNGRPFGLSQDRFDFQNLTLPPNHRWWFFNWRVSVHSNHSKSNCSPIRKIHGISIGPMLQQEILQLQWSGPEERSFAPDIPGIDVGALVQQQLGCRRMTVLHREREGSVALLVLKELCNPYGAKICKNAHSDMTVTWRWHDVDIRVTWQWPNGTRFRMTNWKMPRPIPPDPERSWKFTSAPSFRSSSSLETSPVFAALINAAPLWSCCRFAYKVQR